MCFRPAYAGKPVKCPSCGKLNPPKNTECIQCKTELPSAQPGQPAQQVKPEVKKEEK